MNPGLLAGLAWRALKLVILLALVALVIAAGRAAHAGDNGQIPPNVPDNIRAWFKSVRSPHGVPCCDIADGHRTTWRGGKDGGFEVPILMPESDEAEWVPVPPEAVVYSAGNPVGEAVVWYVIQGPGAVYIRCFVPGDGV